MSNRISIKDALKSNLSFYIFKGNQNDMIGEIESYFDSEDVLLNLLDGDDLDVDDIRLLIAKLNIKYSNQRVFIISNFENVTVQIQNMLLKIIEELGENKTLIALCQKSDGILDTILSRSFYLFVPNEIANKTDRFVLPMGNGVKDLTCLYSRLNDDTLDTVFMLYRDNNLKISFVEHTLEYFNRIKANCNKDLCLDLLIYKTMEDK